MSVCSWSSFAFFLSFFVTASTKNFMVCYYLPSTSTPVSVIPPDLCTHINFAFAKMTPAGIEPNSDRDLKVYGELVTLKKKNPKLKIILSIQKDWGSVADKSEAIQKSISKKAVKFLQHFGFDGCDLDWEYPGASQKQEYGSFVSIFSSDLHAAKMSISMALPNNPTSFKRGYNVTTLVRDLDLALPMLYDFNGAWQPNYTGYNSPLYTPKGAAKYLSTAAMVDYYLSVGFPASKLAMGMPVYGRSWTLKDPSNHGLNAPAVGAGAPGPVRKVKGIVQYDDVCKEIQMGASATLDHVNGAAYLYRDRFWASYESKESAKIKISYMNKKGLAGIMLWSLNNDDVTGTCKAGRLPLVKTFKGLMESAM